MNELPPVDPLERGRQHRALAFGGLTAAQVVALLAGFLTGPILARELGPSGRGLLATFQIPVGLAPYVAQLGLGAFALNVAANGVPIRKVIGSLAPALLVVSGAVAVASPWIAEALSGDRPEVTPYLIVGLALLPIGVLTQLVLSALIGVQRWRVIVLSRVLSPLVLLAPIVVLATLDELTVKSACVVALGSTLASTVCIIPTVTRMGRVEFDRALLTRGLKFGARAWPGTLASLSNQRLDQLLMIPLLSSRQLGLYAVAVTVASLNTVFAGQLTTLVLGRVAAGESALVTGSLRATLLVGAVSSVLIAIGTILLLTPIFGASFAEARNLVLILLPAYLLLAGTTSLGQSLAAAGRPSAPTVAEFVGLAVTVPGLVVLLPSLEATGAALVSCGAYAATFAVLVVAASRAYDLRMRELLLPTRRDLAVIWRNGPSALIGRLARHRRP